VKTPVAVFCYRRPNHLRRLMKSLALCDRVNEVEPVIFCDGARDADDAAAVEQTRQEAGGWQQKLGGRVVLQNQNLGLAKSVISGVSELCSQAGRVIVVEDDLVLGRQFLDHHLASLDEYESARDVWQVSGFAFRLEPAVPNMCYFFPIISTWGWSTWKRAWDLFDPASITVEAAAMDGEERARFNIDGAYPYSDMLADSLNGRNDSWGIRWNWRVFQNNGLVLYPPVSLAHNAGFDGSGSHCNERRTAWQLSEKEVLEHMPVSRPSFPSLRQVEPIQRSRLHALLSSM